MKEKRRIGLAVDVNNSKEIKEVLEYIRTAKIVTHLEFNNFKYGSEGKNLRNYIPIIDQASRENISMSFHFSSFARLYSLERKRRTMWKARLEELLVLAQRVNALWVNLHMGQRDLADTRENYLNNIVKDIQELRQIFTKLPITFENSFQGSRQKSEEIGVKFQDFEYVLNLIDAGMVLDIGHFNITGESPEKYVEKFPQKIKAVHVHSNNGERGKWRDSHEAFTSGTAVGDILRKIVRVEKLPQDVIFIAENNNFQEAKVSIKNMVNFFRLEE